MIYKLCFLLLLNRQSEQLLVEHLLLLFLVLCACDPHVLEGGQTCEDAAALPAHDVALGWSDETGFDFVGQAAFELLDETIGETFDESVAAGEDDFVVEGHAQVDVDLG